MMGMRDDELRKSTQMLKDAKNGNLTGIKEAIRNGEDINRKSLYGHTPLFLASRYGHTDVVKWLLDNGADSLSTDCDGYSPMYWSFLEKHSDVINIYIEHDIKNKDILINWCNGDEKKLSQILNNGNDKNSKKNNMTEKEMDEMFRRADEWNDRLTW